MKIPQHIHRYFWNVKLDELDSLKHKSDIIETLLERGDVEALRWMLQTYGKNDIIAVLRRARELSPKSRNFWAVYLNIEIPHDHARRDSPWEDRRGPG